jgi:transposase-like protein
LIRELDSIGYVMERINKEIKRRSKVVGAFPN